MPSRFWLVQTKAVLRLGAPSKRPFFVWLWSNLWPTSATVDCETGRVTLSLELRIYSYFAKYSHILFIRCSDFFFLFSLPSTNPIKTLKPSMNCVHSLQRLWIHNLTVVQKLLKTHQWAAQVQTTCFTVTKSLTLVFLSKTELQSLRTTITVYRLWNDFRKKGVMVVLLWRKLPCVVKVKVNGPIHGGFIISQGTKTPTAIYSWKFSWSISWLLTN